MYLTLILVLVIKAVLADDETDELMEKCRNLNRLGARRCCNTQMLVTNLNESQKECFEMSERPETLICLAKKRGYASDDGTIDKQAYLKIITEDFQMFPSLIELIKDACVDNEYKYYGPESDSDVMRLQDCKEKQIIFDCNDWSDYGPCAGMEDFVRKCEKMESSTN